MKSYSLEAPLAVHSLHRGRENPLGRSIPSTVIDLPAKNLRKPPAAPESERFQPDTLLALPINPPSGGAGVLGLPFTVLNAELSAMEKDGRGHSKSIIVAKGKVNFWQALKSSIFRCSTVRESDR